MIETEHCCHLTMLISTFHGITALQYSVTLAILVSSCCVSQYLSGYCTTVPAGTLSTPTLPGAWPSYNIITRMNSELEFQSPFICVEFMVCLLTGKGGKNRRRGKNENEDEKRELVFKEDGQGDLLMLKTYQRGWMKLVQYGRQHWEIMLYKLQ